MRNLVLAFCSIRPQQINSEVLLYRENEYAMCLRQLKRVLPDSFDLIICENTIDDFSSLKNENLSGALHETNIIALGTQGNIGTRNKGLGELLMLKVAMDNIDISQYENICYVTARRIYTCPYAFDKAAQLEKSALLCNPDFLYVDGTFEEVEKEGMYNDMFFAMKAATLKQYADYSFSRIQQLNDSHIGSEQNLYSFIHDNDIDFEWLDFLGLIRNEWETSGQGFSLANFHIT